jgi:putative membrane protein
MMGFMGMWWLWLIIIAIVVILFYVVNSFRTGVSDIQNETPLDLLKKRFVKGEINKLEFEEKKKDLLN